MPHSIRLFICAIAFLAGLTPVLVGAQDAEAEPGSLFIRGGWLFDGISDTRRRNSGILIRDGKIVGVDVPDMPQDSLTLRS